MSTARKNTGAWDDRFYVEAYRLAKSGLSDRGIAEILRVNQATFRAWCKERPALKEALSAARSQQNLSLKGYVSARLPEELQDLWDRIEAAGGDATGERVEAILRDKGTRVRQHLFVHALTHGGFSAAEACRRVNVSRKTLADWCDNDPDFAAVFDEIQWHQKNLYESALIDRIRAGDTPATIFANRTFNRDRGYGESSDVKGQRKGKPEPEHAGTLIDLSKLKLSPDVAYALYKAVKNLQAEQAAQAR